MLTGNDANRTTVDDAVPYNVNCHRCAYNLRGLKATGNCPECAAPVKVSLAGDALRFADPQWLAKIATGAKLVFWPATPTAMVLFFGGLISTHLLPDSVGKIFVLVCLVTVLGIPFVGTWLVTSQNPTLRFEESWYSYRRITRYSLAALAITVLSLITSLFANQPGLVVNGALIVGSPIGILGVAGAVAYSRYCAQLALRVMDFGVAHRARLYSRGFVVGWSMIAIGVAVDFMFRPNPVSLIMVPGVVIFMLCGGLIVVLPANIVRQLQAARQRAEKTWSRYGDLRE